MHDPAITIILSRTQTKFGRCIRKVARQQYNHASVALDDGLEEVYAFARPNRYDLLSGRLVRERRDRFTMGNGRPVPVAVYRIPVTQVQAHWVRATVRTMAEDPEYLYNLFSVLTYPVLKGFSVWKAYSCVEFAAFLLRSLGLLGEEKPLCSYRPDDLASLLADHLVYRGDIRDCLPPTADEGYFAHPTPSMVTQGLWSLARIAKRSVSAWVG
ncbi:MAG: hypothetical protein IKB65_06210 [Ruminiclostridium sp.]|nr:hypothetical protein [Ruminiclostridium sp.]